MPIWLIEGDAVHDRRRMHVVVRPRVCSRRSPMEYRALGERRAASRRNIDRWFCGSYRDYIPDHYELGYQICSYAWDALRREHLGQGRVVRVAQPLRAGHHARGAGQILQDQRHKALPRNLRRAGTLLGFAAGNRGQRRAAHRAARKEPHDLPVAPAAGRHGRRGAENRPTTAFRVSS